MQTNANTWHLIHAPKDSSGCDAPEEVVLNLQGVLWKHDLPPFTAHATSTSKQLKYLRQSVSLTGLGTPYFEASMKALTNIYVLFSRFVPADKLQACAIMGKYGEHVSMDASNRYFTTRKDNPMEKHIPFDSDVDPNGILERAAGGSAYIHSEHNIVRYYERVKSTMDSKYNCIPPVRFRDGDIIEVQMTILLVPLLHGQFKMMTTLRSLTLVDTTFSQVTITLKRKIGYRDEDIASTREKLTSRMDIGDATPRGGNGDQEAIEQLD
ncbi:hypothetical protein M378DRAFT_87111 [Amanita muscaria Koide BX008]|uniref:Uncharacterized protein n=1 Tax=Amanita muscaria (strain Koide BX008) TaxID=946122 RepID=A0A0C2SVE5_AMAMK|nr:hypothetical protein M378DRAFT_87111 [Amanita muscaria Koide BX008]